MSESQIDYEKFKISFSYYGGTRLKAFWSAIFVITKFCRRFKSSGLNSLTLKISLPRNVGNYQSTRSSDKSQGEILRHLSNQIKTDIQQLLLQKVAVIYATLILNEDNSACSFKKKI
jgi:hypothetical protein